MESFKAVSVIAAGLASYLVPTFIFHKKNMCKTTILKTKLDFDEVGIKDMIVKTNNSEDNNYVLRRDTIESYNTDKDYIVAERLRVPKVYTELNHRSLSLNGEELKFINNFSIVGFYDTNFLREDNIKKKLVFYVEALREKDEYYIAIDKSTNKIVCIGEYDKPLMFYWTLRKRSGYFRELWFVEAFLLSYAFYIYMKE